MSKQVTCSVCGKAAPAASKRKKYCGHACQQKAYRQRVKQALDRVKAALDRLDK